MTITSSVASAEAAHDEAQALRTRVRDELELEYLRLHTVDRPALRELLGADDDGTDVEGAGRELAIVEDRIAAIHDYLGTIHDPYGAYGVGANSCVLLDTGLGRPRWFLLAALPVEDDQVIAVDSSLGRAVAGARPGQTVRYRTDVGPCIARVLDAEPSIS